MCVIIDANVASEVFGHEPTDDGVPVARWLLEGDGVLVHGGRLTVEMTRVGRVARALVELKRAGKTFDVSLMDPTVFQNELDRCAPRCRSNDVDIIATARLSGARTLFTRDVDLMGDFTNANLVSGPRGRVYQQRTHAHLLRHTHGCRRPVRRVRRRRSGGRQRK